MVQLKDFVSETLKQVIEGILAAQVFAKEKGALVNPRGLVPLTPDSDKYIVDSGEQAAIPQFIEFDVAVSASESGEAKAGVGIFAGAIGVGTQAKLEGANSSTNRIRFSVPVQFPRQ
jgi:hypothetical protein